MRKLSVNYKKDDTMPQNEWWFDLEEHVITVEYKKETGKWFLVVRRKEKKAT